MILMVINYNSFFLIYIYLYISNRRYYVMDDMPIWKRFKVKWINIIRLSEITLQKIQEKNKKQNKNKKIAHKRYFALEKK